PLLRGRGSAALGGPPRRVALPGLHAGVLASLHRTGSSVMSLCATLPQQGGRDEATLRALAERAGQELEDATAHEIVRWAAETFGERLCVTSSMQDTVLAHLASSVVPGIT